MMPGRAVAMSRSNSGYVSGRRKQTHDCREKASPGTGRDAGPGHAGVGALHGAVAGDPDAGPAVPAGMSRDIDIILDKQAACYLPNTGIRRLLEMRREERLLQQQLGDSYDP